MVQAVYQSYKTKLITFCFETNNDTTGYVGKVGSMSEFFSFVDIAHMHFHKRYGDSEKRVSQGDGCVSECCRIDDDSIHLCLQAILNTLDDGRFAVGLKKRDIHSKLDRQGF